jgi:hypothetical protein
VSLSSVIAGLTRNPASCVFGSLDKGANAAAIFLRTMAWYLSWRPAQRSFHSRTMATAAGRTKSNNKTGNSSVTA